MPPIEQIIFTVIISVVYFTSQAVIAIYEQKPEYFFGGTITSAFLGAVLLITPFQADYLFLLFGLLIAIFVRGVFTKFKS